MWTARDRIEQVLAVLVVGAGVGVAVVAVTSRQWWLLVGAAGLLVIAASQWRQTSTAPARRRASTAAAAGWTPDRVRAVTDGVDGEVQAVRAVRRADPALGLADAVAVVRAARGGPGH